MNWLDELLYRIMMEGSSVPGGWFTITLLFVLLAVAVAVAIRVAMRTMRTNRGRDALFGAEEMSAAQHRATAEQYAAQGDWASAIRHRLRAVARHLEETAVLNPVPGRTATELARDAGAVIPGLAGELRSAAVAFNDVTYGEATRNRGRLPVWSPSSTTASAPALPRAPRRRGGRGPEHRLGRGAMTDTTSAVGPTVRQRWRTIRWVLLALGCDHRRLDRSAPT